MARYSQPGACGAEAATLIYFKLRVASGCGLLGRYLLLRGTAQSGQGSTKTRTGKAHLSSVACNRICLVRIFSLDAAAFMPALHQI